MISIISKSFSADVTQCPLKNMFAKEIYDLAMQAQAICTDAEEEVYKKIALRDMALECKKLNINDAIQYDKNNNPISMNFRKLEIGDRGGSYCEKFISYKNELARRISDLTAKNNALVSKDKRKKQNMERDQAAIQRNAKRQAEYDAYVNSPAHQEEFRRSQIALQSQDQRTTVTQSASEAAMKAIKDKLHGCGINPKTSATTSISQMCKKSLENSDVDNSKFYCMEAFGCNLND